MEFDPDNFSQQGERGSVPAGFRGLPASAQEFIRQYVPSDDDQSAICSFSYENEFKPFKSQEAGREIYEPVLYTRINIRGNDKMEVHRPTRDEDKKRFPFSWQQFQQGQSVSRGTPLNQLPGIDPGMIRGYAGKNIHTIEDLALVSDANLQNIGLGGRDMRRRAIDYVEAHKSSTGAEEIAARAQAALDLERERNAKKDEQIEQMMRMLAEQQAQLQALQDPPKKKPGPKPKASAEPQAE